MIGNATIARAMIAHGIIAAALFAATLSASTCYPINTDRIYARDLAAALPVFGSLSPDLEVGFAAAPGQQRMFHVAELRHIALTNHLQGDIAENVCFAWPTEVPARERISVAMHATLKGRNPSIEILDQSLVAAPKGELVFPLSGLCGFSAEPVIWRGYVAYGANQRFSIWARARVSVKETRLVVVDDLVADQAVGVNQLRVDTYEGPLSRQDTVADLKDAVGMMARFDVAAGTVLTKSMLEKAKEVERGDTVAVIVETAGTRIEAEGVAEQAGRTGAVITVRNAKSGSKFRARVEDKDKVLVVPGGPFGLVTEGSKS